ncbi:MAG: putative protein ninG [Prokaryotic dsDNA virus sp.]|nr:MAG: putative protein ninG [Prokaryotic dsDNA virus sp.]|tara:strand:- start:30504 stop:31094 length:591 start_codon:yes stop_codon:yes gene_type:complete
MANSKRKCKSCGDYVREFVVTPKGVFCNIDSAVKYSYANKDKGAQIVRKAQKKKDTARKKELMTRSQWFDKLQKLVNQYVREVKEVGQPCCTCNQVKSGYDCGHYKAVGRGGADRRRFTLMNLHRQCRHCNSFNGGKPVEYRAYLIERYGLNKVEWLEDESNHPELKEQFPTTQDIENEIKRYRELLKAEGLKPNA